MGVEQDSSTWDDEAVGYDEPADHGLHAAGVRGAWRDLLLAQLPDPPAAVADLGCGTASLSVLLAAEGFAVHGVDFSAAMLERARAKADGAGVEIALTHGDVAVPPLGDGLFDVVLCRHVLWAVPDPAAALGRWLELLRPDGRLVLIEGMWGTGVGLASSRTEQLVREVGREPVRHDLTDPALWGRTITDHRYLVTA
ncbi:class I SAM-dependent methyltransferase [Desertihabitans aurantiacus]|uniref:class I SAM-dependent methyltransferase n=1 Tax=Desertihabitans aurantiacus TaxID=2282477 RepID=UPI0018E515D2|nr:class I SAM-dependent methyltransferase [Desertihabitans aurantiacus]